MPFLSAKKGLQEPSRLTLKAYQEQMKILGEEYSTWEGKDNVESCSSEDWGKPALPPIQENQHQACK